MDAYILQEKEFRKQQKIQMINAGKLKPMEKLIGLKEAMNQQIQRLVQEKVDDQEEKIAPGKSIGDLMSRMRGLEKIGQKLTVEDHRKNGMEIQKIE